MNVDQHVLVVTVDPGASVGVAATLDGSKFYVAQFRVDSKPDEAPMRRLDTLLGSLFDVAETESYTLLVGCEKFVTQGRTSRKSHQPHAQLVAGRVGVLSPVPVAYQTVGDATRFAPDRRLRALGLWTTAGEVDQPDADDANSAMRHNLLLLARRANTRYAALLRAHGQHPIA